MTTPQTDKVKPRTRADIDAELNALSGEMAELERTIAVAKERLIVIGRRVRSLLYARKPDEGEAA
jgi:hypothetical protein